MALTPKNHGTRTKTKFRCLLIKGQCHLHSLHSAESMSCACSLGLGYPTANFQWPMIALGLVLFKSCFVSIRLVALGLAHILFYS